jgi:hypothetical protein
MEANILNFLQKYSQNLEKLEQLESPNPKIKVLNLFKNATISASDICRMVIGCMDGRFVYCDKSQKNSFFGQDGEIFGSTFYAKGAGNCSLLGPEAVESYFKFYLAKFPNLKEIDIQAHHECGAHGLRWQDKSEEDIFIDIIRLSKNLNSEEKMFLLHELSKFSIDYHSINSKSQRSDLLTTHALLWARKETNIIKKLNPNIKTKYNLMRPQKQICNIKMIKESDNGLIKDVGAHRENGINVLLLDPISQEVANTKKILEWQHEAGFTGFNYTQIMEECAIENIVELSYRIANCPHSIHLSDHGLIYQVSFICTNSKAREFADLGIAKIIKKFVEKGLSKEKINQILNFNILMI